MASVQKFTHKAVVNQLRHNNRTIENPSNSDIDGLKKDGNYRLSPDRQITDYEYYKQRKSELYCYNREDVKTMCGWVVTAPVDLAHEQHREFFKETYNFLEKRYGENNVVQAIVHNDESGQPHLHFCFIPALPDLKHGGEKFCANDILTRSELRKFHPDLQKHLQENNINARVLTGITSAQGGNRTVEELKKDRERERERGVIIF